MNKETENNDNAKRFEYLVSEIITHKKVWLLKAHDGLYAMFEDANNQAYLPIWPGEADAARFSADDWEGYIPEEMAFGEFLSWTDELKEDNILIGAYPNENMQSMSIDPTEFKQRLLLASKG